LAIFLAIFCKELVFVTSNGLIDFHFRFSFSCYGRLLHVIKKIERTCLFFETCLDVLKSVEKHLSTHFLFNSFFTNAVHQYLSSPSSYTSKLCLKLDLLLLTEIM
jgi:hypothetical protein